ncbi:MAG: hypothetical protein WA183_07820, partial [Chthoniobacterales bacterium]
NLPSGTTPRPNLARTAVVTTDGSWDAEIWRAFQQEVNRRYVAAAITLEPSERLYRLGWISAVFRLSPKCMLDLVTETKLPTLWLTSSGLDISEGGLEYGKQVHKAPDEIAFLLQILATLHFCQEATITKLSFQWKGPRTLMMHAEDPRSAPMQFGIQISATLAAERLVAQFFQFLMPPTGVNELLSQTVTESTPSTNLDDYLKEQTALGVDARKALLNAPQIIAVLELAKNKPHAVQLSDRILIQRVFPFVPHEQPAILPLRFEKPFDTFAMTRRGDLNVLHVLGNSFIVRSEHLARLNANKKSLTNNSRNLTKVFSPI